MGYIYEKTASLATKPDEVYNMDNFGNAKKGKQNIMMVGGYSGAGKSTITKQLKNNYGAKVMELDDLKRMAYGKFDAAHTGTHPKFQRLMKKYISYNPGMKERMSLYGYNTEYKRFVQYVKDYAKKHPNEKIIMEGIQALGDSDMRIPRYLVGTGAIEATRRAKERAKNLPAGHHYGNPGLLNLGMVKKISKERKAIDLANTFQKIEQTNFGPTAKKALIRMAKHPFATGAGAGAVMGTAGLAAVGAGKLIGDSIKKRREKDMNKSADEYIQEIYKIAGATTLSQKLTNNALSKTAPTKSSAENMLNKYKSKQLNAMNKVDGVENLLKDQTNKIIGSTKKSTKLSQTLM